MKDAERYVENGITHLILRAGSPDYNIDALKDLVTWRDDYRERNPEAA